jgi:hypothetical protein
MSDSFNPIVCIGYATKYSCANFQFYPVIHVCSITLETATAAILGCELTGCA